MSRGSKLKAQKKGKLIIFSAPSGSGKTTLVKHVMGLIDSLSFSISACSREKRPNEVDGIDYYFISADEFRKKIQKDEFVEWEEVYPDHYYGTLYAEIERLRKLKKNIVFDVDVVGGLNIKKIFIHEALAIFVKPPSFGMLRERLYGRASDSSEKIEMRLAKAIEELAYEGEFDVTIINDDLDIAQKETYRIVKEFIQ